MSIINKTTELVREIYDRNVNYYTGWLSSQRYSPKMFPINTKIPYSIEFKAKNYLNVYSFQKQTSDGETEAST